MAITRRDLMKDGLVIAALGLVAPSFLVKSAYALPGTVGRGDRAGNDSPLGGGVGSLKKNILVVIQLSGGNDGLGTVIPYTDRTYFTSRPSLAPKPEEILKLTDNMGLHPAL
ncbi:MAG: hypothetical protein ABIO92_02870, partial [Chloroflexia bacterium]